MNDISQTITGYHVNWCSECPTYILRTYNLNECVVKREIRENTPLLFIYEKTDEDCYDVLYENEKDVLTTLIPFIEKEQYHQSQLLYKINTILLNYKDKLKSQQQTEVDCSNLLPKGSLDLSGKFRKRFI